MLERPGDNLPRPSHASGWTLEDITAQHEGATEAVGLVAEGLPIAQFVDEECAVARLLVSLPARVAEADEQRARAERAEQVLRTVTRYASETRANDPGVQWLRELLDRHGYGEAS